jgi:NAD(P)-dependent dehydrogenase (short-subunit alcohol dehydrogenase family)
MKQAESQKARNILITGASSGLGLEAVRQLAPQGGRFLIGVRDVEKARQAMGDIQADIQIEKLDLSSFESVRTFAARALELMPELDLLINNAGVMMPPFSTTREGFEIQFGTNHLGHFLLTSLLLPALKRGKDARIVSVSSNAHKQGKLDLDHRWTADNYSTLRAYADSKLANLVFSIELSRRLKAAGSQIRSLAAHPGWTHTPLFRHTGPGGWVSSKLAMNVHDGTLPIVMAATASDAQNGEYFGPTGLLEMWGRPGRAKPKARALNPELGKKLWEVSEKAIGSSFAI